MMDGNVMPYPAGDERNAIVDAMADAEHEGNMDRFLRYAADLERMGYRYGDTPARRRGHGDDWDSAGVPVPDGARRALAYDSRDPSPHIGAAAGYWSRPRREVGTYHETDASW